MRNMALGEYRSTTGSGTLGGASQGYQSNGGYIWRPNGSGGVDYFRLDDTGTSTKMVPITREQYSSGSGQDVGAIEQQVANDKGAAMDYFNQLDAQAAASGAVFGSSTPAKTAPAATGGTNTISGNSGQVLGFATLQNGQTYNLDDPTQKQAFFTDKMGLLQGLRQTELAKNQGTTNQNIAAIDQQITDTQQQAKDYVGTYDKNVNQFGQDYSLGNTKRGSFFSGLSPNAFQSSQGSSQQFAENQYLQGLGDMAKSAQQNVGSAFMANPNDPNQIAANTAYGRNVGDLVQQKNAAYQANNDFIDQSQQDIQNQAANTSTNLSVNTPFKYDAKQIAGPALNNSDTSMYTPFTTFQQGNVQVPVGQSVQPIYQQNAFTGQTPLDSFLGKNALNKKQNNYFQKYLLTGQTS